MAKTPVSDSLKALRKEAKKLKVDFEPETTEAELQILVDAANAANGAQAAKAAETGKAPEQSAPAGSTPSPQEPEVKEGGDESQPAAKGEQIIQTLTTRNKEKFELVQTKDGVVLRNLPARQVLAEFATVDEGKHHLENLSRF